MAEHQVRGGDLKAYQTVAEALNWVNAYLETGRCLTLLPDPSRCTNMARKKERS